VGAQREGFTEGLQGCKLVKEEVRLEAPALSGIDPRLKAGLPLLVPIVANDDIPLDSTSEMEHSLFRIEYAFIRKMK
jgi:hypothetical protein